MKKQWKKERTKKRWGMSYQALLPPKAPLRHVSRISIAERLQSALLSFVVDWSRIALYRCYFSWCKKYHLPNNTEHNIYIYMQTLALGPETSFVFIPSVSRRAHIIHEEWMLHYLHCVCLRCIHHPPVCAERWIQRPLSQCCTTEGELAWKFCTW